MFYLLFFLFLMGPTLRQWRLNQMRLQAMRSLERRRNSRVITLIHRQETMGFWGMFQRNFINIEDSEEVLRVIRMTPDDTPIDLVVHTPGGLLLAAEQIAEALRKHRAKVTVFVPHYAMSGGTLIALAADEIVMDRHAVLGPVDPQLGQWPAASILKVVEQKPLSEVDDQTLIMADVARKAISQTEAFVRRLLVSNGMDESRASELSKALTEGRWTHDYPINIDEAREMGLPVSDEMPEEICALMRLYPQSGQGRPSVQYVPLPNEMGLNGQTRS
ncbi:ClpP class periplasmic serine protease [Thermanaerovibrio velox DSM 12556]|uniref:ClpP class periplasmic serine protease n=1 Tax=Thermanaerovibrio velox DSM 12556 TaxID=926567 RepID=H0UPB0_9BACT|nr:ATP-dependent Clp protease proteolytic subunit [Thermanaerovibrio velox]EHM09523.1 ClpP class periplasmic serine protease [Thermanaerovibrio velox DSM 12556]